MRDSGVGTARGLLRASARRSAVTAHSSTCERERERERERGRERER